jgi:hypothetical protein
MLAITGRKECSQFDPRVCTGGGATITGAAAFDEGKYPDFGGQCRHASKVHSDRSGAAFDPSKPFGRQEKPPLTPEYQAIYEASLVAMEKGGQGIDPTYSCLSPGMPRVMIPYIGMEFVVTPPVTYTLFWRDIKATLRKITP